MYKEKICRVCGKPFIPKSSRQMDCNNDIVKECIVCGKEYLAKCSMNYVRHTCSKECQQRYMIDQQKSKVRPQRVCKLCGELFTPVNNTQTICSKPTHTRNCTVCGSEFQITKIANHSDIPCTCSPKCKGILSNRDRSEEAEAKAIYRSRLNKFNRDEDKVRDYMQFLDDPRLFISNNYSTKPTLYALASRLGIAECTVGQIINDKDCRDCIDYFSSLRWSSR